MSGAEVFVLVLIIGLLYWLWQTKWKTPTTALKLTKLDLPCPLPSDSDTSKQPPGPDLSLLDTISSALNELYESSHHPDALLNHPKFIEGVELLNGGKYSSRELIAYYQGENVMTACMALEAIARRSPGEDWSEVILANVNEAAPWIRYFALRALCAGTPVHDHLVSKVVTKIDRSWKTLLGIKFLREFIKARLDGGEEPVITTDLQQISEEQAGFIQELLQGVEGAPASKLLAELQLWRSARVDFDFLRSVGRVWNPPQIDAPDPVVESEALLTQVNTVQVGLLKDRPRSVLLVGESGVGKSTIMRVLGKRLQEEGWVIFEAGHTELVAGKVYIGEMEERFRKLLHHLGGKRKILWYIPDFQGILWSGRHQYSANSALDFFLPYIEQGEITVLGEVQPLAYEKLIQSKPDCRSAMEVFRIHALSEDATLEIARKWVRHYTTAGRTELASEETLREAWQLTQQYLGDKSAPGNMFQLLKQTRDHLSTSGTLHEAIITINELILTLTQLTGLPASILDDRQRLDLKDLRGFFEKKVLGQPEAVDCLVDRVAMIKAAVGDPSRPQGVFLFVGPTGTGKTEIAKALSEYLFSSPTRMIRLDMSEFQGPESLERILGDSSRFNAGSLVDLIRKQPFSVILLDEFEKANPRIWDLFLQVFDDGRLTDQSGITADFRHAIIIMTSNLGGAIPSGASLGFSPDSSRFSAATVERTVNHSFRKEFLNRIDRIIVFRPLNRDTMREILHKELDEVFLRRGFRNRNWAVEWDDAAIEFLLQKGFTHDLGARPLKRAIERYLLSPLANTIVNHQFPEGDQFLFVRSDGTSLRVEFVDPDVVEEPTTLRTDLMTGAVKPESALQLEEIALDALGTAPEMDCLRSHHESLNHVVGSAEWRESKQASLSLISYSDFWNSPDRFAILGKVEYLDRIESGFETAGSLLRRLSGEGKENKKHFPRDLMKRLAQQLYLLEKACSSLQSGQPSEAFILVQAARDSGSMASLNDKFAVKLGTMYRRWAEKRRMQIQPLQETGGDGKTPYHLLLALSGFAAFAILRPEDGLHILEIPEQEDKSFKRSRVQVRVVSQPDAPVGPGLEALRQQAIQEFESHGPANITVVRRYREYPSPLVRDSVREWRTGRLDLVLDGDFDLIVERDRQE